MDVQDMGIRQTGALLHVHDLIISGTPLPDGMQRNPTEEKSAGELEVGRS